MMKFLCTVFPQEVILLLDIVRKRGGLEKPFMTGELQIVEEEDSETGLGICIIKMFKGKKLFAKCELDMDLAGDKGLSFFFQDVTDSSRYWVLRIADKKKRRSAFIGFGVRERNTAIELRGAVQDSLRFLQREKESKRRQALIDTQFQERCEETGTIDNKSKDDVPSNSKLQFAEGQTIKINVGGISSADGKRKCSIIKTKNSNMTESTALLTLSPPPEPSNKFNSKSAKSDQQNRNHKDSSVDDDWSDFSSAKMKDAPDSSIDD